MDKNLIDPVITSLAVITAAVIGGAVTHYVSRKQNRKEAFYKMYKDCYAPMYILLYPEIQKANNNVIRIKSSRKQPSIRPTEAEAYKQRLLDIIKHKPASCPSDLYQHTYNLSPKDFEEYCLFIKDNYYRLQNRLNLTTLKPVRSITVRRIASIAAVLIGILALLAYATAFIFNIYGESRLAITLYFGTSVVFLFLILILEKFM